MVPAEQILQPVLQQDRTGCAIACAASIAGLGYGEARAIAAGLGIHPGDPALWGSTAHLRRLLAHLGCAVAPVETPFSNWRDLPDRALLAIKWRLTRGGPQWHWTVFVRSGEECWVLDPKKSLKTHRRTDFGRIHPRWSIEIYS